MNIIINLLISSFIAHGFLDFYTFKHLNDLSSYLSIIAIYMYIITLSPDFGVAGFVVSSIYHFGQDFKYFDQSAWSGAVLFGTAYLFYGDLWIEALDYLKVVNTKMFIGLVAFSLVPGIIGSITKLRGMAIALVIGLFGPIGLCFYMSLMHAPLGVYRFGKKSGYLFWGICTFVVMLIIPKIHLHVWLLNLSISIVMAHVVAITIWQLHQDYLLTRTLKNNPISSTTVSSSKNIITTETEIIEIKGKDVIVV